MKLYILAGLLTLLTSSAFAQFQIGDAQVPTGGRAGSLRSEDLEAFKKSTTVFVLQTGDADRIDMFRKSIAEIWTVTPFRVVLPDSARFFRGKKYSSFGFGGFTVEHRSSSGMVTTNTHVSYDLTIPDYDKHGEQKGRTILARFILSPDMSSVMDLSRTQSTFEGKKARDEREEREANRLYKSAQYANWGPGQIRGYLKSINDLLAAGERRGMFEEITEKDALTVLSKDTLILPQYLRNKLNAFTGTEKAEEDEGEDEDEKKAYPFPFRYVSSDELENILVNSTKPVYHLIYVRSSTNKYVSVVEAKSGRIIFSRFTNLSYNFKMKDLKAVAKYAD